MIFISYSHTDAEWCQDLLRMAAPLTRQGGIQAFSDADIAAGSSWRTTIQKALDNSAVGVLLVSRHFLASQFIMDIELPYVLNARSSRGLIVLWVLVSDCLYKKTDLQALQAALPTKTPLEAMSKAERSTALRTLCEKIERAWNEYERPKLNMALHDTKVTPKMENLTILSTPATRRTEIFIRPDNSADCYHQGAVLPGHVSRTCYFGSAKTKPGNGFHVIAITTDLAVPHQGGKPTNPLPKHRTLADGLRMIRV